MEKADSTRSLEKIAIEESAKARETITTEADEILRAHAKKMQQLAQQRNARPGALQSTSSRSSGLTGGQIALVSALALAALGIAYYTGYRFSLR